MYPKQSRSLPNTSQIKAISDIDIIKKNLLYEAQKYNVHTFSQQKYKQIAQHQKDLQKYSQYNKNIIKQLQTQKQKQQYRKNIIRQQLQKQHEKQIQIKNKNKASYQQHQRKYAQQLQNYQDSFHMRRMNDLKRMYKHEAYKSNVTEMNSYQTISPPKMSRINQPNKNFNNLNAQSRTLPNQPALSYKQYLRNQIDKKNKEKQQQKEKNLILQKQQIRHVQAQYQDSLDQFKNKHRKQQMQFKKDLDQQVMNKIHFKRPF